MICASGWQTATGHEYLKDYKAHHVHVIADSFEKALAACREKYPDVSVKAIEQQNYYGGLPLLLA